LGELPIARCAAPIALSRRGLELWKPLPAPRGNGLGAALRSDLMDEAAATNKAVKIHIEKFNRRCGSTAAPVSRARRAKASTT
jgi:hypothetical protein